MAVNCLESLGKLGDVLILPHFEGHKVSIRFGDDPMGLELLQERIPELSPA